MKVLLTTLNSKFIHTNLAIRYIREYSRYLEGEKYSVLMKEYTINNSIDFIMKDIYKNNVDLIVFSVYIWNVEDVMRICENIKKINPNIEIALGGPEVTYDVEDSMKKHKYIDYIFYGEGEVVYRDFILYKMNKIAEVDNLHKIDETIETDNLNKIGETFEIDNSYKIDEILHKENEVYKPTDISKIRGIAYRDRYGNTVINDPMPLIDNLDEIPSPYENIDISEYENKIVYFESSRGCPFNCQYCLSSAIQGLRYFSVERIKRDLKNLIDARVSQIKFIDRTFNANKKIAKEIMNFLMENDNGYTTYHFEVTAHLIDDDMLKFLEKCKVGLFQFEIGVQSTNKKTLMEVGRIDDFKRLSEVVTKVSSYKNIHQHLDLIAGLPYEDYNRFSESFDDVFSLGIECVQLGFLKMIKGTGIRNNSEKHGYVYKNYPPYEVLYNKYMNYEEILKLKDIEEILEMYYNSGNFNLSVPYIIENYFERPFLFFEDFSRYFDEKGYFDVAHGKNRLYEILLEYASSIIKKNNLESKKVKSDKHYDKDEYYSNNENGIEIEWIFNNRNRSLDNYGKEEEYEIFREILKLDYLSLGKTSSLPPFFDRIDEYDYKNRCHNFLKKLENQERYTPNHYNEPAKNIIKYVHFELFKYNVGSLKKDRKTEIKKGNNTIMFYYDIDKIFDKSNIYEISLD